MKKMFKKLAVTGTSVIAGLQVMAGTVLAVDIGDEIKTPKGFAKDIGSLINAILNFIMIIGAVLVLLYLILGGIEWITSGGDKTKTEGAMNKITSAVIGLIILAASFAILTLVLNFLGFSSLSEVFTNAEGI